MLKSIGQRICSSVHADILTYRCSHYTIHSNRTSHVKSVRACATAAEGPWLLAPMHAAGLLAAVYTADEPGATAGGEPAGRNIPRVSYPPPLFTMLLVPCEQ